MQKLDSRLITAIKYLRHGKILADIGTDHAYLPIYAVENGYSARAVASDINEGPTERARINVLSNALTDKISVVKTDGLKGIDKYDPDDIAIFGMGGELIASIIDAAPWVKDSKKRLILQPMTCADALRIYLAENGFNILEETLSTEGGKLYVTICCEWTGESRKIGIAQAILGEYNIGNEIHSPLFKELFLRAENAYKIRLEGKSKAGRDASYEKEVLAELSIIGKEISNENH